MMKVEDVVGHTSTGTAEERYREMVVRIFKVVNDGEDADVQTGYGIGACSDSNGKEELNGIVCIGIDDQITTFTASEARYAANCLTEAVDNMPVHMKSEIVQHANMFLIALAEQICECADRADAELDNHSKRLH